MPPETAELERSSTGQTGGSHDQWISTTDDPGPSQFVLLSEFDLAVSAALSQVAALEHNWDAQGAYPIAPSIIEAARELLSLLPSRIKNNRAAIPAVVPMRKGNLQFEWHDGPRTLELEIESPSTIHYLKFHPEAGIEEEDICPITDTETLAGLIQWLVGG